MQDRFKFRVWSKKYNKFIEDNRYPIGSDCQLIITQSGTLIKLGLGDFEDDCEDSYSWATFDNYEQDCIVMQCTGLKDKNGKLIYEGDILKIIYELVPPHQSIQKFYWSEKKAGFCFKQIMCEGSLQPFTDEFSLQNMTDKVEVIGNIYENKDLLNE